MFAQSTDESGIQACVGCHTAVSNASTAALTWSIAVSNASTAALTWSIAK